MDRVAIGVADQRVIAVAAVDRIIAVEVGYRVGLGRRLVRRRATTVPSGNTVSRFPLIA
jgi:hypothetical protein